MKRYFLLLLSLLVAISCHKFDDSDLWDKINNHEDRILKLETLCSQMNTNITSLQTIIVALQSNDYIVNVSPIKEGDKEIGYTIAFAKSGAITIYHGKDGKNGKDGKDGTDGKDGQNGYAPEIGVKQHSDGKYYWTLDGTWLLDNNGNMIPTTGKDGNDGANGTDGTDGQDGITPQLKIEDGYWLISYDKGATWQKLGKATGINGIDGTPSIDGGDGNHIFESITQNDDFVIFTLSDGKILKIAKYSSDIIQFADYRVKMLCVANWDTDNDFEISKAEAASVESIGTIFRNDTDIFLFNELQYFTGLTEIEEEAFSQCKSLISVIIPDNVRTIGAKAFWKCDKLKNVSIHENSKLLSIEGGVAKNGSYYESIGAFAYCTSLEKMRIPSQLQVIGVGAFYECRSLKEVDFNANSSLKSIEGSANIYQLYHIATDHSNNTRSSFGAFSKSGLKSIKIPASVTTLGPGAFSKSMLENVEFEQGIELESLTSALGKRPYGIPDNEECYYDGVFSDCVNLKAIKIPKSVVTIKPAVFKGCSSLTDLQFEDGCALTIIGGGLATANICAEDAALGAFTNCKSLKHVVIPASVSVLGEGAFEGCSSLQSVTFAAPSAIKYINSEKCNHSGPGHVTGAFRDCNSLENILLCTETPPSISSDVFYDVTISNITLKVPYSSLEAYKAANCWKDMTIKGYFE